MIRSSKHSVKFANSEKKRKYFEFLNEYRQLGQKIVDHIWNEGYENFNVKEDKLNLPLYLDYGKFDFEHRFSARVLRCLTTQVSSVIRGVVRKRQKLLYVAEKYNNKHLKKKLHLTKISKPDFSLANPELNSICADIQNGNTFDYFLQLKSLGKYYGKIRIPLKDTRVSKKWGFGTLKNSFSLCNNEVVLRFEIDRKIRTTGKIVGIDQGLRKVVTISDNQNIPDKDIHGHSFTSIIEKLSRKKKGSKNFKRACVHRKNFINWSINQADFSDFKEVRLEKIFNIRYGKRSSRKLSHWTNTLIRDKIKRKCEETEVLFSEQDSSYRSQRCSQCGLVRKANRKGAVYKCRCGNTMDADLNAAKNHEIDLPVVDWTLRNQKRNLGNGFYWKTHGFYDSDGKEFTVPYTRNKSL